MVIPGGWVFLMGEVPLYPGYSRSNAPRRAHPIPGPHLSQYEHLGQLGQDETASG
jgi:hypothetical protein